MKKITLFILSLSIVIVFTACESNYVSHQNVGKHVFRILQKLDTLSKENFRKHFVSFKQLQKMIENVKEGDKLIPKIAEMTSERHNADIDNIYDNLTINAENNYIRWKNTKFVDYKYKTTRNRSMTLNYGTLHFKHNEEQFGIGLFWITDLTVSGLLGIGGLERIE